MKLERYFDEWRRAAIDEAIYGNDYTGDSWRFARQ